MTDTNELTVRLRAEADLPRCVEALAGVQDADRYPVDRPADPAGWLTPHGMTDAWVVVAGADVVGHMALTPPGPALATTAGLPERSLLAVARLFVSPRARRRGVAALLLDRAIGPAQRAGRDRSWRSRRPRVPPSGCTSARAGATSAPPPPTGRPPTAGSPACGCTSPLRLP
ncbi:GNAT family N-acetyltransferase [Streptomyces sp. NPDC058321]|uniref:GNAT family N-acetyltransferase n=1 Tax=Streptomyces sp. NPDC058321 TaxID=3346445 RepID=UPI0036EBF97B